MSTFDYFVGKLSCPKCSAISLCNSSTNIQTKLTNNPGMKEYTIGSLVPILWDEISISGYLEISQPENPRDMIILEVWECPTCDSPYNWVRITIKNSIITQMESVLLNTQSLNSSNYITEESRYLLDDFPKTKWDEVVEKLYLMFEESDQ